AVSDNLHGLHSATPDGAVGKLVSLQRSGLHGDARSGLGGDAVSPVTDDAGVDKVLVEVVDVFDAPVLERPGHGDVVEDRRVLDVFAEAHAAGVRADRDAEMSGQKLHG